MAVRPVTPIGDIYRLSREVADTAILNPLSSSALEQGEWLIETATGWARPADSSTADRAEMVWSKRGEAPTAALGKVACFTTHEYIVETDMFDDALVPALGGKLTIDVVTVGGVAGRAALHAASSGEFARATIQAPLPADNGGWLRVKVHAAHVTP